MEQQQIKQNEGMGMKGMVRFTLTDVNTGEKKVYEQHNLIVTAGKVAVARRLGGIALLANEGQITYGATGTGTTAVAAGDTQLDTELARKATTGSYSSNVVTVATFFSTAESNGTITEFGLFGEAATGVANSGTLFERVVLTAAVVKTASQTLTVDVVITVS